MKEWWRAEGHVGICRAFRWYRLHLEKTVEEVHQVLGRDLNFVKNFASLDLQKEHIFLFLLWIINYPSVHTFGTEGASKIEKDAFVILVGHCSFFQFFQNSSYSNLNLSWARPVAWAGHLNPWDFLVASVSSRLPFTLLSFAPIICNLWRYLKLLPFPTHSCPLCKLFRFVQICSACSAFLWLLLSEATMTRKLRETGDEAIATWPEREPQIESNRNLCHKRNRGIISVVFCRWKLDFTWFYRFTSFYHV